jgi:hypothetical protein
MKNLSTNFLTNCDDEFDMNAIFCLSCVFKAVLLVCLSVQFFEIRI